MIQIVPAIKPSKFGNGKASPCDLTPTWFPGVGWLGLYPAAKRSWDIMAAICKAETGAVLTVTSAADAYRSYDRQESVFRDRYRDAYSPLTCTTTFKLWGGVKWWQRRGVAPCAVPGTSNHGLGIACDTAALVNGKPSAITASPAWLWLVDNAVSFGWSWEGALPGQQGWEPWHLRHVHGDDVAQRVKDIEAWFAAVAA